MELFSSHYSDPSQDFWFSSSAYKQLLRAESSSETGSIGSCGRPANSLDEEVMLLASNNPKKRAGRKKFRETRHPVFRGVRKRNSGKWVCEVREPKRKTRIWLGTFPTLEMAARAHDVAALALRGRLACLNFADSAWRLPIPASSDSKDIQKAAAEAAEAFRPQPVEDDIKNEVATSTDEVVESPDTFMDEEALFGMHGLLASMAEGLMMPPPRFCDDVEAGADVSLWSYSI